MPAPGFAEQICPAPEWYPLTLIHSCDFDEFVHGAAAPAMLTSIFASPRENCSRGRCFGLDFGKIQSGASRGGTLGVAVGAGRGIIGTLQRSESSAFV